MAYKSEESMELYDALVDKGFPPEFCELISGQLNTPWTANRMLGYLSYFPELREEDVVDEMLGILADRDRIRQKKEMEHAQSVLNEIYARGLDVDEEE